jgi:hypothetical protein
LSLIGTDPQWTNAFYTWPPPTLQAERWRYETIKSCKEVVKHPVSKFDARAKLKEGFSVSLEKSKSELLKALSNVSPHQEDLKEFVEQLPLTAARLWIDMNTQRCRFYFVLRGTSLRASKDGIKKAQGDSLDTNLQLELRKYGDSKGQDLEIFETLKKVITQKILTSKKPKKDG